MLLAKLLSRQAGVLTVEQAVGCGLSAATVQRRARRGDWAADRADSAAERLLVGLLRAAGITGWVLGHPFGRYRIDLAFPAARLAIEVDGWAWHVDLARFRNDRRKGNAITQAGWDLLRFTWHDLDGEPAWVLAEITRALGA